MQNLIKNIFLTLFFVFKTTFGDIWFSYNVKKRKLKEKMEVKRKVKESEFCMEVVRLKIKKKKSVRKEKY